MNEEENPLLRALLDGRKEDRECIEFDVWVPVIHPLSEERVNVRCTYHDHSILAPEAQELTTLFELPAAENTPDDYYNGKDEDE